MHRTEGAHNVAGLYTAGPPPTTITADAMNSIQEEISNVVEYAGITLQTAATDTRDQLLAAVLALIPTYDAIVVSQSSFDALIERTAANTYQFKDGYESIFVKKGTYLLTLSGGDTWGQLQTNDVVSIECESGASINFGNTQGYLHINTAGCVIKNLGISGLGTVASAISYSFYINALLVVLQNCSTATRLSNTTFYCFRDNTASVFNKYVNCTCFGLTSSGAMYGFSNCYNLTNCTVYDINSTGAGGNTYGFSGCYDLSNCISAGLDSAAGVNAGFSTCVQISSSKAVDLDTTGTGVAYGFHTCSQVSSSIATDIQSVAGSHSYGFYSCAQVSGCKASHINSTTTGQAHGFS